MAKNNIAEARGLLMYRYRLRVGPERTPREQIRPRPSTDLSSLAPTESTTIGYAMKRSEARADLVHGAFQAFSCGRQVSDFSSPHVRKLQPKSLALP